MKRSGIVAALCLILGMLALLNLGAWAAEPVDMVVWVNWWPQEAITAIQKVADMFAAQHPDTVRSVKVQDVSQDTLVEKLTLNIVGDIAPDVITLPAPFVQYQIKGLIQSIEPYMAKSKTIRRQDYPPVLLGTFAVDGKQYGIPAIEVGPGDVLAYNLDMFAQAGLPESGPQSLDQVYQWHKKLSRVDGNTNQLTQLGINPLDSMGGQYFDTIWSTIFDVNWYDAPNRKMNLTAFQQAVDWIKNIYDTPGYDLISSSGINGWTSGLNKGKLGMQINGYWVPGELRSLKSAWNFGFTWMPTIRNDKATAALPWGMALPTGAKHPELSFQLMEFFSTPQAAQTIFDAVGWLNGNLNAMRRLTIKDLPIVAKLVGMFDEANRFLAPEPMPIMETLRNSVTSALGPVWKSQQASRTALETWQKSMQQQLDAVYAAAKK